MMRTILIAAAIAFVLTAVTGKPIIRWLQKEKFGQKILEIGPKWHMNKQYTPTMGGFMFMLGITVSMLAVGALLGVFGWGMQGIGFFSVLLLALAYGCVGFVDDWAKIKKKENAGLTPKQKLILQVVVAGVFISLVRLSGLLPGGANGAVALPIPGTGVELHLPWIVYMLFAIFAIVAENNAVNLTDGIDGLAAGVTLPVSIFFLAVGVVSNNLPVVVFSAALAGGLAGFLIFNFNPAKVFMGDTGSLFLGGAVAGLAFACDMPIVLVLVGLIYVVETLSDIIQVAYYKKTKKPVLDENGNPVRDKNGNIRMEGKRIFKKAPIHHHFQVSGWSEKKIVFVFGGITILMCILAYIGVMPRY